VPGLTAGTPGGETDREASCYYYTDGENTAITNLAANDTDSDLAVAVAAATTSLNDAIAAATVANYYYYTDGENYNCTTDGVETSPEQRAKLQAKQAPLTPEVRQVVDLQAWQVAHFRRQTTSLGQAAFEAIAIALTLAVLLLWLWVASSFVWEQLAPALESVSIHLSLPIHRSIDPERAPEPEAPSEPGEEPGRIWINSQISSQISSSGVCSWGWKALRCSAGCKVRMHWPGLQASCTPI